MTPETFGLSVPWGWEVSATRNGLSFARHPEQVVVNVVASADHRRATVSIVAWLPTEQQARGDFFRLDGREVPAAQVAGEIRRLADRAAKMGIPAVGQWVPQ